MAQAQQITDLVNYSLKTWIVNQKFFEKRTQGRCFQPTKTFHLFLLFSLKHAQNPLLVFLAPSSLPNKILLFSWLFCVYWFPQHVSSIWCTLSSIVESSAPCQPSYLALPLLQALRLVLQSFAARMHRGAPHSSRRALTPRCPPTRPKWRGRGFGGGTRRRAQRGAIGQLACACWSALPLPPTLLAMVRRWRRRHRRVGRGGVSSFRAANWTR